MTLSDKHISEFQELYRRRFGKELTRKEAHDKALKLLSLMSIAYRPMTWEQYETVQERRRFLLDSKNQSKQ